jgi:hypothetical protein
MRSGVVLCTVALLAGCAGTPGNPDGNADEPAKLRTVAALDVLPAETTGSRSFALAASWSTDFFADFTYAFGFNGSFEPPLAWAVDFDGDLRADAQGTALPAFLAHRFEQGGDAIVRFAVRDAKGPEVFVHSLKVKVPRQVVHHDWVTSYVNEPACSDENERPYADGGLPYTVAVPAAGIQGGTSVPPPTGSVFHVRVNEGPWQEAPLSGTFPAGMTAYRMCPATPWAGEYEYTVTVEPA